MQLLGLVVNGLIINIDVIYIINLFVFGIMSILKGKLCQNF